MIYNMPQVLYHIQAEIYPDACIPIYRGLSGRGDID